MGTVNKVILVGNLGTDPDLRYTSKGPPVCHLSVATSAKWKDAEGNAQSKTCWHRVVAWGKQGELCKEYLSKGRQVYVEGRLQGSSYVDKDGVKRYSTEVVSSTVVFLGGNGQGRYRQEESGYRQAPEESGYRQAPEESGYRQAPEESGYRQAPEESGYRQEKREESGYRQEKREESAAQPF